MRRLPPLQIPLTSPGYISPSSGSTRRSRPSGSRSASIYDEGILLSHTNALVHGSVPYRDFILNIRPGSI